MMEHLYTVSRDPSSPASWLVAHRGTRILWPSVLKLVRILTSLGGIKRYLAGVPRD